MNNKDIIKLITDIENEFDVNCLTYKGVCVWPYIRNKISEYLTHRDRASFVHAGAKKKITNRQLLVIIKKYSRIILQALINYPLTQCDILFLGRTSERASKVQNKWFNRHSDSFADFFEKTKSVRIIEYSDNDLFPSPQHRLPYYLDLPFLSQRIKYKLRRSTAGHEIKNYSSLEQLFIQYNMAPPFTSKDLSHEIELIFDLKCVFLRAMQKCKPKLLFLVCYYTQVGYAAILAGHELGVPVVEFQHGSQNDKNPYLTHWSRIPARGYELLPNFFWNWGGQSAARITSWARKTTKHKAFVGGNLWASKWVNDDFSTDDCSLYNIPEIFPKGCKHILISLQLWPDHFPDYLCDVIENGPSDWYWHIRQHPRHCIPDKWLKRTFLSFSNVKIEEHYSRQLPLYLLLRNIDLHLTGYSTVAFEAAMFNVPTIFFHENAMTGFKGIIDQDLFYYVSGSDEMVFAIEQILRRDSGVVKKSDYIDTNPQTHSTCLEEMIATCSPWNRAVKISWKQKHKTDKMDPF